MQVYDAPAETILFWHMNMFFVLLKTNPKCQIQDKAKFVRRRLAMFLTSEDLLTRFSIQDETRLPHLVPESKNESH